MQLLTPKEQYMAAKKVCPEGQTFLFYLIQFEILIKQGYLKVILLVVMVEPRAGRICPYIPFYAFIGRTELADYPHRTVGKIFFQFDSFIKTRTALYDRHAAVLFRDAVT